MPFEKYALNGPIPGENFTSDVKNYPWHRPPQFTELDEAVEYVVGVITEEKGAMSIISMLEMEFDVATIVDIIITKGISKGKWSVDLGLILAGPIAHIIILMAKEYEVDYELGLEEVGGVPTSAFFNEAKKVNKEKAIKAGEEVSKSSDVIKDVATLGFMGEVSNEETPEGEGFTGGFA